MASRQTDITTTQKTGTMHRVSIGLIAVSLGLLSLALGTALFISPGASFLFVPGEVSQQSAPSTATAVSLTWTAPGDDGNVGQAASYNLRYATSPITDLNFATATAVTGLSTPLPAGSTETSTVTNLQPATTYFFAIKTSDKTGNVSGLSNVATKTTAAAAQACVPIYTCSDWTACLNSLQTRTCTTTNSCPAGLDAPIARQSCTVVTTETPPGGTPSGTPGGTPNGTPGGQGGGPVPVPVHVVNDVIVAGLAPGGSPLVRVIDPAKKKVTKEILAFSKNDKNGVNVASGDVTGDNQADVVVGTGAGTDGLVKIFSASGTQIASFVPYPTEKKTGVAVATGDVNGDGVDEIITVPAKSAAQVRVWRYDVASKTFKQISQAFAYDRNSRPGFTVAAGDLDLDGRAEIVVAPRANARSIALLKLDTQNQLQLVRRFNPFPLTFTTGLTVAVGDVFGSGRASIIVVSGPSYYSDIRVFDMAGKLQTHFLPTSKAYRGGLTLATLDVNKDGRAEIITGTYKNGDPGIRAYRYNGLSKKFGLIQSYFVYPRTVKNGLRLGGT